MSGVGTLRPTHHAQLCPQLDRSFAGGKGALWASYSTVHEGTDIVLVLITRPWPRLTPPRVARLAVIYQTLHSSVWFHKKLQRTDLDVVEPPAGPALLYSFAPHLMQACQPPPSIKRHLTVPAWLSFFSWCLHPVPSTDTFMSLRLFFASLKFLFFSPCSATHLLSLSFQFLSHSIPLHPSFASVLIFFFESSAPLACLALRLFAYPCCLVRIAVQNRFNAKDMWHKPGICSGGLVPRCSTDLSQISLMSHCSSFLPLFTFFHFDCPRYSDSFFPYRFPSSLFIYFTWSHRWLLVMSSALFCLCITLLSSTCLFIPSLFLCLCLGRIAWYLLLSLRCYVPEVSAGEPRLSHVPSHTITECMEWFNPQVSSLRTFGFP